jgi:cell filamentation protein
VSEQDDPYLFPDVPVLRNRLGIKDEATLDYHERELVTARIVEGAPSGDFDLAHLRRIHRHLFQDIYDWAGEVRTVEISKGGSTFQFCKSIPIGMADVHRRLERADFLCGLSAGDFAKEAGQFLGDVNYVHPFREGNGRTQLQYLKQLGRRAGHIIDLTRLNRDKGRWIEVSIASHQADYGPMSRVIREALV